MKKYVYIKRSIANHFVDFTKTLKADEYNNLGSTWEDYLDNKWVLLNSDQVSFYKSHKNASVKEVWDMNIVEPTEEELLENAKANKLADINVYDGSDSVNSFTIGGQEMWLTVNERQQLATQISANEAVGRDTMTRWFNGVSYTFTLEVWKNMLAALEVYAGDALNVTESHKAAVMNLKSVDEVNEYDHTIGYPEKLTFTI